MTGILETRVYQLFEGTRDKFHTMFSEGAVPMLERYGITVVDYGPSALDETGYYLVRAYGSLEERQEVLDRFYGSDEWLTTYDEPIMAMIDKYFTVVMPAGSPLAAAHHALT